MNKSYLNRSKPIFIKKKPPIREENIRVGEMRFVNFQIVKPKKGQRVIWVWAEEKQAEAGFYLEGEGTGIMVRRGNVSLDRWPIPSHWIPFPENWPNEISQNQGGL